MVVAMIAVWMMQMPGDQIIKVVAMWHHLMPAIWTVLMGAFHIRRTPVRKVGRHAKFVFLDFRSMHVV